MANGYTQTPQEIGTEYGGRLYNLQRQRLARMGQGQRRDLARFFAGRGRGSSAAASAWEQQLGRERSALAEQSLQSQLEGEKLGFAEAQRREQIRQFGEQLSQNEALAKLSSQTQLQLADIQQQMARERMAFEAAQAARKRKSGFLGSLFGGVGKIAAGFLPGGGIASALGLFGSGGGGGGYDYSPYVNNPYYGQSPGVGGNY